MDKNAKMVLEFFFENRGDGIGITQVEKSTKLEKKEIIRILRELKDNDYIERSRDNKNIKITMKGVKKYLLM